MPTFRRPMGLLLLLETRSILKKNRSLDLLTKILMKKLEMKTLFLLDNVVILGQDNNIRRFL